MSAQTCKKSKQTSPQLPQQCGNCGSQGAVAQRATLQVVGGHTLATSQCHFWGPEMAPAVARYIQYPLPCRG